MDSDFRLKEIHQGHQITLLEIKRREKISGATSLDSECVCVARKSCIGHRELNSFPEEIIIQVESQFY